MVVSEISLPVVIGGALVDSIAPCVIGVMILLMVVLSRVKDRRHMLLAGLMYIAGVYVTYFVAGVTLLQVFEISRSVVFFANFLYIGIGSAVMAFGLLEIKDIFWYGRWFSLSLPAKAIGFIEHYVKKTIRNPALAFLFGIFVVLVELPCTGAPYLAVLALISFLPFFSALPLLLLHNLIFVLPIITILVLVYRGMAIKRIEGWRRKHRRTSRMLIGLLLIGLGHLIVSFINPGLLPYYAIGVAAIIAAMFALWKAGK